jgi:DNA polymerase III epsilon subunit-like protein
MSYPVSLIFDTETTGLPPTSKNPKARFAPYREWENKCRIVQIAWTITGPQGELLETYNTLVQPDGFTVSKEAEAIHGFSTEHLQTHGIPIEAILQKLMDSIRTYQVEYMVAHNLAFDYHVVMQEMYRLNQQASMEQWKQLKGYCTLKNARKYCKEIQKKPENFKLVSVYRNLIGEMDSSIQLHHADSDIQLCKEIYHKIYQHQTHINQ